MFLKMERVFKSQPILEGSATNDNILNVWRSLSPISVSEVIEKTKINIEELDLNNMMVKSSKSHKGYIHGMIDKKSKNLSGLARCVLNTKGGIIEGWIQNNHLNGFGRYIGTNGSYSVGMHTNNRMNGFCSFTKANGKTISGIWKDGKLVEDPEKQKKVE